MDTHPLSAASLTMSGSSPRNSVHCAPHLILSGLSAVHNSLQYVRLELCRSSTNAKIVPSSMPVNTLNDARNRWL